MNDGVNCAKTQAEEVVKEGTCPPFWSDRNGTAGAYTGNRG